jgi:hypothetical protein
VSSERWMRLSRILEGFAACVYCSYSVQGRTLCTLGDVRRGSWGRILAGRGMERASTQSACWLRGTRAADPSSEHDDKLVVSVQEDSYTALEDYKRRKRV